MAEYIEEEFTKLAQQLDFLNTFSPEEITLLHDWRILPDDLGTAVLKNESIVKEDGRYYYSLYDDDAEDLVIDSKMFLYLENILNYRSENTCLEEICDGY